MPRPGSRTVGKVSETEALAGLIDGLPEDLADKALTHSSWVESRAESYGRLAFLGDSVLGLSMAAELHRRYPKADSGELTRIHNQAVSGRACAEVARELGLPERLAEREPDDNSGMPVGTLTSTERPIAEIAEAVIGACYLEYGFDRTAEALLEAFAEQISYAKEERLDFKSELQERLARTGATVTYEVVREEGPAHDRRFEVTANSDGEQLGSGSGRSKKEAEQAAAEESLEKITD